ncbi:hypothetical protein PLESTB_001973600 [Pleodorina starrii]|uniref:Glutathione-independent formaldehyde dehydrogenase n=1 Tax=Pleodorina starrii TaxID=330485 RepID=A0A9W6C3C5_9CHLO|nr:hypothetical protein PLESTB_001973600 [Pleodorina starrii]
MKAVVYQGPHDVAVTDVPDAKIERPTDVLVRVTTTNICGSDLHMYEGRTSFEKGRTFGHENMGEVVEIGKGVEKVKVGDRVVLPFNISCGFCKNCERGLTNYCLTTQPDPSAAELLRVPFGDHNALRLGEDAQDKENDYVMLSDIFPTGYHATEMAGVIPGDSVVIAGAGPVGLMAALSATIKGAAKVMVVDRHPDRLALAEQIGAIAIDDSKVDPVQAVLDETMGLGADRGCEPTILRATKIPATLNMLINSVRFTGGIGTVGVFVPQDPGAKGELAKQGKVAIDFGTHWFKGQTMGNGQAPVKRYNRRLRDLIAADKAKPSWIVSHEISLDQAADAYRNFDARSEGWTKTEVLSIHDGEIKARKNDLDEAGTFTVDGLVADASVGDYDALLLPGGTVNPDQLRVDKDAVSFVRDFVESGKPVAAICHGPWTLIEAGVAAGRTLTSFPSIRTDLRNAGADVVGRCGRQESHHQPLAGGPAGVLRGDRVPTRGHPDKGRGEVMSVTKGLLVRFDALPGKEDDVKEFLDSGRALVEDEQATTAWFAFRLGPTSFGIFDVFPDDAGRDAHPTCPALLR